MGSETPMETTEQRNAALRSVQTMEIVSNEFRLEFGDEVFQGDAGDVKTLTIQKMTPEGEYKLTATVVGIAEDEPADDPVEAAQAEPPKEGPRGLGTKSFG